MADDSLACSIREIPLRICAQEREMDEDNFIKAVKKSLVGKYFLCGNCEELFEPIAKIMYEKLNTLIMDHANKKRHEALIMDKEQRKLGKDAAELFVWLNSSDEFNDPEISQKLLEDVSPSAMSTEYLRYHNTSDLFFSENVEFFHPGFGNMYTSTIDVCLETFFSVDTLFHTYLREILMISNNLKTFPF